MRVSVISTVLNEGESIRRLLEGLAAQTRPPDEVVIVDGGSSDGTVEIIWGYADRLPLKIVVEPGANISRGRNVAIEAASGGVIASVDAGVRLEPAWLENLLEPLAQSPELTSAVAGAFMADPLTTFETAMGVTVLPDPEEIDPEKFLPSSRSVAYTQEAWAAAGRYPEWLDYCEDLVFDFRLREAAGPFAWAPEALVHFRPRSNLRAFFKQYYRYARGDGKADLWRLRHAIRYGTYLVVLPALLLLSIVHSPLWLVVLAVGVAIYCRAPFKRLRRRMPAMEPIERLKAALWIPVIRAVGDVAKMAGFPVGWAWRIRNWGRPEIHWR